MSQKNPKLKKILYLPPHNDACAWYRCIVPGLALRKRGWHVDFTQKADAKLLKQYDIIVFQRANNESALKCIEFCNSLGILTVGEIDDNLWLIHETNPAYEVWTRERLSGLEKCLRAVRLITTTTHALADYLKLLNSSVVILPNMLPSEYWQVKQTESLDGQIVIGWAGSSSHWPDLEMLKGVIPQILDEYSNAEFHIAGLDKAPFPEHKRIKIVEPVHGEDLALLLATFNIGLVPLISGKFNDCKSDLKFIEYAMVGLPVVASKVDAYKQAIVNGENGFLAGNPKDWLKYLRRLLNNPDLRQKMGENARKYAETRTIEQNIWMWEKAYGLTS
jgi:glycosyltransferase involved in cell wall biosynthesis